MVNDLTVHLVDDQEMPRRSLTFLLVSSGFAVRAYDSVSAFLDQLPISGRACLIKVMRMSHLDGLQLLERLNLLNADIPTIFVTGDGDVADGRPGHEGRSGRFHQEAIRGRGPDCRHQSGRAPQGRRLIVRSGQRKGGLSASAIDRPGTSGSGGGARWPAEQDDRLQSWYQLTDRRGSSCQRHGQDGSPQSGRIDADGPHLQRDRAPCAEQNGLACDANNNYFRLHSTKPLKPFIYGLLSIRVY
jgi:CheY-like chemotaxis protein